MRVAQIVGDGHATRCSGSVVSRTNEQTQVRLGISSHDASADRAGAQFESLFIEPTKPHFARGANAGSMDASKRLQMVESCGIVRAGGGYRQLFSVGEHSGVGGA